MITYISMIRGINIGGKRVKMAELRDLYVSMGFLDVKTYIQSGNVIFKSENNDQEDIVQKIVQKILETFNYSVKVVIRTLDDLNMVVKSSPFKDKNEKYVHVTFLSDKPSQKIVQTIIPENIKGIKDSEQYIISAREIYLFLPEGYGRTKLNNNFFEKKLELSATTRNWKTVNKLLEIAKSVNNE